MPKFFFHLFVDDFIGEDTEGVEFGSLNDALDDARQALVEYIRDEALGGKRHQSFRFEVTDDTGHLVATIPGVVH